MVRKDLVELYESVYQCDFKDLMKLYNDLINDSIYDDLNTILLFHKDDKQEIEEYCMDLRVRLAVSVMEYNSFYSEIQPKYSDKISKKIDKMSKETKLTFIKIITGMTKFPNTRRMYEKVIENE